MPYLAFNLNNGNEFVFDLVEDRLSLGRSPRNEIVIENNFISYFHAELLRQKDGNYQVIDLKSSGGIFVNEQRINSVVLKPDDRVHFGPLQARYVGGDPTGPRRVEEGAIVLAAEKMSPAENGGVPDTEEEFASVGETTEGTAPPSAIGEVPRTAVHRLETSAVAMPESVVPGPPLITSPSTDAPAGDLGLEDLPTAGPQARPPEPLQTRIAPSTVIKLKSSPTSLIAKAPALAAAMEAGVTEERTRMEKEREVMKGPVAGAESCLATAGTQAVVVDETKPEPINSMAGATTDISPLEHAKAELAAVVVELERSKRELESVQRQRVEHKSKEQNTRGPLECIAGLGKERKADVQSRVGAPHDHVQRDKHISRVMELTILTNLLLLAAAVFLIHRELTGETDTRIAAYKPRRPDQSRIVSEEVRPALVPQTASVTPALVTTTPVTPTPPPFGEDIPPTQRELVLLKERNRLTAYADEAIATGGRAPYERLWESFDDPRLANLVDAIRAEILRVQTAYLSGSRLDRFDIPVGAYFPEESGLTDRQLKDGQLIQLLREAKHPWEVRMKAANLLGTRRSTEVGDALVHAVKSDANLDVVKEATFSFEQMTGYHSKIFDAASLEEWWKQYKTKPQPQKTDPTDPAGKVLGLRAESVTGPVDTH